MANKKLTDLTELTTPADGDFLYIVDVSDTTESAQGTSKKIRKDKVDSGASKENLANKQDDLTIDGTGTKYPTVDAVNAVLPTTYSKVVYVNATSPTTATIFDTENPPVTNDNALKNDTANLYIGTDASTWVYLTGNGYLTKTVSSATSNFNTFGTSVDAGNSKTSHITRSGAMTLTGPLNILNLKIATTPTTSAGSYDILTRNSSTTALEKVSNISFGNWTYSGGLIYPKSLTDKVAIGMNSEGLGVAFTVKALSGSTNIAYFYDNSGIEISKITQGGLYSTSIYSSVNINAPRLNLSGEGGIYDGTYGKQFRPLSDHWLSNGQIKYQADYSSTYTTRSIVDKAYTDGKITQTITNGVTDKSPSEDAVFDALALKVEGSGTNGNIAYWNGTASQTGNSNLFWDNTNKRLGVGTASPTKTIQLVDSLGSLSLDGTGIIFNRSSVYFENSFPTGGDMYFRQEQDNSRSFILKKNGKVLIGTITDDGIATNKLQVNGNVKATQFRISALNTAPASATDTGTLGEVRITATHIYVCTATNTWVRTELTTW